MRVTFFYILDWALITISFFNTIALLWLGLTVLLNAERRGWGTWVAGGGILLGGLFFAGHSTIVGRVYNTLGTEIEFWWRIGWFPFILGPYLWYLVIGWYTGVLEAGRHRTWLLIVSMLGAVALGLLALTNALPTYAEIQDAPTAISTLARVPVLLLIYPMYSVLCVVLALSALRHPEASHRFMGDVARRRARPWLMAASCTLLGVGLAVGAAAAWFLDHVGSRRFPMPTLRTLPMLMVFDLLIISLIALVTVLMGRAVVSYEIFTGKSLPSGELFLQWRRSLVLAAGYGAVMGLLLGYFNEQIDSIYRLLLATIVMTAFFALANWRSYTERERGMERLRPFVASQQLYDRLLGPATLPDLDAALTFHALCRDVLDARGGYLVGLGPLAPLAGEVIAFPTDATPPAPDALAALTQRAQEVQSQRPVSSNMVLTASKTALATGRSALTAGHDPVVAGRNAFAAGRDAFAAARNSSSGSFLSPQTLCVAVDPACYSGALWAVPLWSERGLIGALLLGEKRDDGVYTQEEIEIARAAGERLLDTQASAELARRLMALQRQRLAESQVLDRRTRRALHDDVLPRLHTALLMLSQVGIVGTSGTLETATPTSHEFAHGPADISTLLTEAHQQIAHLLRELPATAIPEVTRHGLIGALQHVVSSELHGDFDAVAWQIAPEAEHALNALSALNAEVVFCAAREAIRNAARYGRNGDSARPLRLHVAAQCEAGVQIIVSDDGVGIGVARTTSGGSGQGLALHSTMMAVIGGALTIQSTPDDSTRVTLSLPI